MNQDGSMQHIDEMELHEYVDNELSPPRRAAVEEHLATCAACRAQVADLRRLFARIEAIPDVALARDLTPSVTAALPPKDDPLPAPWWLLAVQLLVTALALVFVWGFVAQTLEPLAAIQLDPRWVEGWTQMWNGWQQGLLTFLAQIESWRAFTRADWLPALSPATWAILMAITALLWLGGTRWALVNRNQRNGDWI